jgi:hypothetical protein
MQMTWTGNSYGSHWACHTRTASTKITNSPSYCPLPQIAAANHNITMYGCRHRPYSKVPGLLGVLASGDTAHVPQ